MCFLLCEIFEDKLQKDTIIGGEDNVEKSRIMLEKEIKKIMIKWHQQIFGKGPDEMWVKINRNLASFYCAKTMTNMEEFLLDIPDGETEVKRIRITLASAVKERLCSDIQSKCGVRVLDISWEFSISSNACFGTLLFQEDFD